MIGNVWEWTSTTYHFRHLPQEQDHYVVKGASYIDSRKGHVNYKARISTRCVVFDTDWSFLFVQSCFRTVLTTIRL